MLPFVARVAPSAVRSSRTHCITAAPGRDRHTHDLTLGSFRPSPRMLRGSRGGESLRFPHTRLHSRPGRKPPMTQNGGQGLSAYPSMETAASNRAVFRYNDWASTFTTACYRPRREGEPIDMRTLTGVVLLCVCVAAIPASAWADDAIEARARYESGVRHFDLTEYEPALADFKEAYRNKPDPVFLYNIAQCHRKLGNTDEAIAFYQNYLRREPDARNREEVERRISELEAIRQAGNPFAAPTTSLPGAGTRPTATPAPVSPPTPGVAPTATPASTPAMQPKAEAAPVSATPSPAAALDFSSHDEATPKDGGGFYKRWWFWTAVGVVAAGTATAAIIMARRDPTDIPDSTLGSQRALP